MTQHPERTFPIATVALLVAALTAAFAIGYAISREQEPVAADLAQESADSSPPVISDLEKETQENPTDAAAWQKLGIAYFLESRHSEAAKAYDKATQIDGSQPALWSALGESLVMASEHDPMPKEAVAAFEKAISIDKKDPRARYFLAVKKDLGGDHQGAMNDWLALLTDTPQDAPWRDDLVRTIGQVAKINKVDVSDRLAAAGAKSPPPQMPIAAQAIPGPSAQDLAAASKMPPSEQRDMAEGMVSRLETRLKGSPDNVDGWIMLIRSRMTLEQPEKAKKALADALTANPDKAGYIKQQAGLLGL